MATETQNPNPNPLEENPRKTLTEQHLPTNTGSLASAKPPSLEVERTNGAQKEGNESKNGDLGNSEDPVASSSLGDSDGPVTDMQRKMRRAERFGMPVKLSEDEKRSSRAERFGTTPSTHGSDTKKSEDVKRKARAERFGLPVEPLPAEEEAKKKARLARFAQGSKNDSAEEDKRKARSLRFSGPASTSVIAVDSKEEADPAAKLSEASEGV